MIWQMCDEREATPEAIENGSVKVDLKYPGSEVWRMSHHYDCPHKRDAAFLKERGPTCTDRCRHYNPVVLKKSYEGCVLGTYERNGYNDSDFFAIVWDEESQTVKHVEYATTRGWTYPNSASVDATPETIEKARCFQEKVIYKQIRQEAQRKALEPVLGKVVVVVRGRKVPVGTEGEISWQGAGFRGTSRVGIRLLNGTMVFTAMSNVEVQQPEQYLPSEEEMQRQAHRSAQGLYGRGQASRFAVSVGPSLMAVL